MNASLAGCLGAIVVILSLAMAAAWFWAMRTGKSGLIDATWSVAVGAACLTAALWPLFPTDLTMRRLLVAAMAAAWSARLGSYILARNLGAEDDPRYADLKRQWGGDAPRQLFLFLQAQALAGWPLAGAALLAAHVPTGALGVADALGALIFVAGLAGETTADRQMARFRAEPGNRGGICEAGLWAYSRHPNYFFEWLCWLGYAVIAADFTGRYRWGWLAFAAPATMYWLLAHVSGVPPLEAHLARSRPAAFNDYAARVNAFWPWRPAERAPRSGSRARD
jgi:steroid 5-alpha reductase family enzyme